MVLAYSGCTAETDTSRTGVSFKTEEDFGASLLRGISAFENGLPISSDSKDTFNIQLDFQDSTQLVGIRIQQENGEAETFPGGSRSLKDGLELLQTLLGRIWPGAQKLSCRRCCVHHSNGRRKDKSGDDDTEGCNSRNEMQRGYTSCGTSTNSRTPSDTESGDVDSHTTTNGRKRPRHRSSYSSRIRRYSREGSFGPVVADPVQMVGIACSDEEGLMKFYRRILNDAQQDMSKKVAKWWIKAINPNKQSKHPYAKGPEGAPEWWPETPPILLSGGVIKGNAENRYVRHVEPDHLSKPERLNLLPHILNLVTDPCQLRNLNSITVAKLEQITSDSINNETSGKHRHGIWRAHLKELFRVARQQERYKNGETDGNAMINVHPSYNFLRQKSSRNEQREDSKSNVGSEEGADDDRKPASFSLPMSQEYHKTQPGDRMRAQRRESDVNQGCSDYIGRPRYIEGRQQMAGCQELYPNQSNYNNSMPNHYQPPNQILQEPMRRHSDTPGPYYGSYLTNIDMNHTSNMQYTTFPSTMHLSSTMNGSIAPPPPLISAPMPRPTHDVLPSHSFNDTSLFNRPHPAFHNLEPEFGRHGNLQQQHQPLNFRADFSFQDGDGGHHLKQARQHTPGTFRLVEMGGGDVDGGNGEASR